MKITKRSQFFGVLDNVDGIEGQGVISPDAPFCHLASFVENWLRLGVAIGKGVTGTAEAETAERRQRYCPVETLSRRERTANGIRGYNSVAATERVPPNSMYRPNLTIVPSGGSMTPHSAENWLGT
jgi:hypothetical protein